MSCRILAATRASETEHCPCRQLGTGLDLAPPSSSLAAVCKTKSYPPGPSGPCPSAAVMAIVCQQYSLMASEVQLAHCNSSCC
ncbi:hypothetical protein ATCV1_z797R [Acanthocystis turfacea chlorella virus 1]|uniref:Uncharacterized protein z797R n=1 Tax=Chlorovirus heliozoae TaxID=322019 RepID=A7KA57_9PHYC|nr:hypothetical protein ATCV1_z797R [Acanthocystis turfacea chlorella virus 1]ABT16931.1 hypothetical protein ATCV1_z797R [Acanthocystis turfacea chlorella virus 1]